MNKIGMKLRKAEVAAKVNTNDELVSVDIELYPEEVLLAAQAEVGKEKITDYFVEMYRFGYDAMLAQSKIQAKQLTGIRLTHRKLHAWLKSKNIIDIVDLQNPAVLKIYLNHHIKQMEESLELFRIISAAFIGEKQ